MAGSGIDLNLSVWLVYLACSVALLAMLWRWMRPASLGAFCLVLLGLVLLLPFGVPGQQALAPAWIVVLFELSQGRNEAPIAIAKLLSLLLFLLLLGGMLWRRIRARSSTG